MLVFDLNFVHEDQDQTQARHSGIHEPTVPKDTVLVGQGRVQMRDHCCASHSKSDRLAISQQAVADESV